MDTETRVQILDDAVGISYSINNFGKGLNPIMLLPGTGKYYKRLSYLVMARQPVLEKKNSEFKLAPWPSG